MNLILLRSIATLQIAGASASAIAMFPIVFDADFSIGTLLVVFVMYAVFGVAFVSGIWLWNDEIRGRRISIIVQVLQIPVLWSTVLTYQFVFGIGILVNIVGQGVELYYEFGASSNIHLFNSSAEFRIGINIWALFMFLYLSKTQLSRKD